MVDRIEEQLKKARAVSDEFITGRNYYKTPLKAGDKLFFFMNVVVKDEHNIEKRIEACLKRDINRFLSDFELHPDDYGGTFPQVSKKEKKDESSD